MSSISSESSQTSSESFSDSSRYIQVKPSNRFKTPGFVSGIYLKYFICKSVSLYRYVMAMAFCDILLWIVTTLTLVPTLQIDSNKVDMQLIIIVFKLTMLLISLKFTWDLLYMKKMRRVSKLLYAIRLILVFTVLLQDISALIRLYNPTQLLSPES